MALLDSTSLYSNNTITAKWANGKIGEIIPTKKCQYIFVEHEYIEGRLHMKYLENEWEEKCPVIACGFVYHWLRHRKRKTLRAKRLDVFIPEDNYKTPMEIYDLYIEARKSWFLEYMNNRPDVWKFPDLEKLFYEQSLTTASEEELILKSEPLLDYLDEEDREEFIDVMKNFLDYVAHIVEPYQHVMENATIQKQSEQKEMDAKWPNPKRIKDNKVYTIDSPEILEYAKNLTELQTEILRQLVANAGKIKAWQDNPVLNQYSESEIWEACCPLYSNRIILAFMEWGHVSALKIEDKGKLVLRKKNSMNNKGDIVVPKQNVTLEVTEEKPLKPQSSRKLTKTKSPKQKQKKVTSIEEYPNFSYNYPDRTEEQKMHRAHRIIQFHRCLVQWEWIPKDTYVDDVFDLFTGTGRRNLIKWQCSNSSTQVLGYLFRQLVKKSIIALPKDAEGVNMWDILSMHFVDSNNYPIDKERLSKDSCREPKRTYNKIATLIGILDPTNIKVDVIEEKDHATIKEFFCNYALSEEEKETMSIKNHSQLSGRKR